MTKLPKDHPLIIELGRKIEEYKKEAEKQKYKDAFMWFEIKSRIEERFSKHSNHIERLIKELKSKQNHGK